MKEIDSAPVLRCEEDKYKILIQNHYYLGFIPQIGETALFFVEFHGKLLSILSFSVSALKCAVLDQWIGWDHRRQYGRLKLG
jgi:hypothetical protein